MYDFIFFTDLTDTIYITKTIGAYKCANTLRANGYKCLVVDHLHTFSQEEFNALLDKIISKQTLGVAFSTTFIRNSNVPINTDGSVTFTEIEPNIFFPQGKEFENLSINKIKSINPTCKIILGGTRVHANYQNKNVDYITIGFSEGSIVNLANNLSKQEPLTNATRSIWGITVIDDRIAASYDFKNSSFSWLPTDVVNAKVLPIEIARGCIFKCKFCSYPMTGKKNLDFIKDIELLRRELQDTYDQFGIKTYSIVDDTFNDNNYKLDLIAEAVKQLTFKPEFWAYIRLDLLGTKNQIERLYDIGVRGCYFGIETLNKETGKIVGKGHDRNKQIATIQDLRQAYGNDIALHGSFIIGLPKESIASVTNTFNQLMDNSIPLHTFDFKALFIERADKVAWTSEFGRNYATYGYEDRGDIFDKYVDWKNEHMTVHDALELERNFRKISQTSDRLYVPNMSIWSMMNYNYSLDYLLNLLHKNVDWHNLTQSKTSYISEYKEKLNKLLDITV
jgi:radical SAM superfamily enzyme YgiQ (UPF0313 family)